MDLVVHGGKTLETPLNEISFGLLYSIFRRRCWLILSTAVICGCLGAAIALLLPNVYRAQALLAPVSGIEGSVGSVGGKLGGLAALAGVSGGGEDRQIEAMATLTSRALTDSFIQKENLLPILFAKKWDSGTSQWRSKEPESIPSAWDGFKLFDTKVRRVAVDRQTSLVTLTVDWTDPQLAASWVTGLVFETNSLLRQRAIERAAKNLRYLNEQLAATSVFETRQAIYKLVENEIKTIMLAQSSDEYAFKIIDPAVIPQEKNSPKRTAMVAVAGVLGLFLGCLIAAFRGYPSVPVK